MNYTGVLTFGKLRGLSENDDVLIYIYRAPISTPLIKEAPLSALDIISYEFTSEEEFFYQEGDYYIQFYKKEDHTLVNIKDPEFEADVTKDKELISIRFLSRGLDSVFPYNYTLEKYNLCEPYC